MIGFLPINTIRTFHLLLWLAVHVTEVDWLSSSFQTPFNLQFSLMLRRPELSMINYFRCFIAQVNIIHHKFIDIL